MPDMKLREIASLFCAPPRIADATQRRLAACRTIADLRRVASRRLPRSVYDYVSGGAEDELTLRRNRTALKQAAFVPNVLAGIERVDMSRTMLGRRRPLPFVLGPTGFTRVVHHEGELAVARAAAAVGIPYTLSIVSNVSMEAVGQASNGARWFGLYPWPDRGLNLEMISRAKAAGYEALVLTVDVPAPGGRERDARNGFTIPPRLGMRSIWGGVTHPSWLWNFLRSDALIAANVPQLWGNGSSSTKFPSLFDSKMSWDDLDWFVDAWNGPFVLKGIMSADDAARAVKAKVSAIVVSNHGGRQLDGTLSSFEALERVVDRVGDDLEVFIDSGFRRGRDIVAALALGARAVFVGRAYLWALAAGGQPGVEHMVRILSTEIERTLRLLGVSSVDHLTRSVLARGH